MLGLCAVASVEVNCFPDCKVVTSAARFSAIRVSTGKSASATLIHCALHPVAINEMLKTNTNTTLVVEVDFMSCFLPGIDRVDLDLVK